MKKIIALLLVLTTLFAFAACGEEKKSEDREEIEAVRVTDEKVDASEEEKKTVEAPGDGGWNENQTEFTCKDANIKFAFGEFKWEKQDFSSKVDVNFKQIMYAKKVEAGEAANNVSMYWVKVDEKSAEEFKEDVKKKYANTGKKITDISEDVKINGISGIVGFNAESDATFKDGNIKVVQQVVMYKPTDAYAMMIVISAADAGDMSTINEIRNHFNM